MIEFVALVIKLTLEVVLACHCDGWSSTPNGMRCVVPRDYPRCEFISGWHPIAFGVDTCSRGNCD